MVNTSRISEDDARLLGLLTSSERFQVLVKDPSGLGEWGYFIWDANLADTEGGTLRLWKVVDHVWHRVAAYAPGWWASLTVTKDVPAEASPPVAETATHVDVQDFLEGNTIRAGGALTEREQIRADLQQGIYPSAEETGGLASPPKLLQDIWEGKGDPDDDPEADEDSWPRNADQAAVDAWVARQEAKEQAKADQLRAESDAITQAWADSPEGKAAHDKARLEYLRDEGVDPLPTPTKVPTHFIAANGGLMHTTDYASGEPVVPSASVSAYSDRVAAEVAQRGEEHPDRVQLTDPTHYSEQIAAAAQDSMAYARQQREIVEDWHGHAGSSAS